MGTKKRKTRKGNMMKAIKETGIMSASKLFSAKIKAEGQYEQ
jgi:hypothetical protein